MHFGIRRAMECKYLNMNLIAGEICMTVQTSMKMMAMSTMRMMNREGTSQVCRTIDEGTKRTYFTLDLFNGHKWLLFTTLCFPFASLFPLPYVYQNLSLAPV